MNENQRTSTPELAASKQELLLHLLRNNKSKMTKPAHSPGMSDTVELELKYFWEYVLQVDHVDLSESLFEIGAQDIHIEQLRERICELYLIQIPADLILKAPSIRELATVIRGAIDDKSYWLPLKFEFNKTNKQRDWLPLESSLIKVQEGTQTNHPFFCVPPSLGATVVWSDIARHLDPSVPIYAFNLGNPNRPENISTCEEIAAYYIQVMKAKQKEGPYVIGGYSVGGLIAFEMAQQLRQQNEISHLIILDTFTPNTKSSKLSNKSVSDELNAKNQYVDPVFILLVEASSSYVATEYSGPTYYFCNDETSEEALLCWAQLVGGGLTEIKIPGTHRSFICKPNVQILANQLQSLLDLHCLSEVKGSN